MVKSVKSTSKSKQNTSLSHPISSLHLAIAAGKRKRGRPRKQRTPEEIAKIEEAKKNKLTLEQKQEIKLKIQKEREAKKAIEGKKTLDDRCYCKNKDLHMQLLAWRNSDVNGFRVLKMVNGKLVQTEIEDTAEKHEKYVEGNRYFVKIPKSIDKLKFVITQPNDPKLNKQNYFTAIHAKVKDQLEELVKIGKLQEPALYSQTKDYIIHEITHYVKKDGWAFNFDVVEERIISNEIGEALLKIGKKLLNHSNFRNYSPELKDDMLFFGIQKTIRGIKNYNFKFSNPFAWITQAFWNSYLITIYKHYKQLNIKKDLMKRLSFELQTYNGMDPRSSLNRAIKNYLGDEFADE